MSCLFPQSVDNFFTIYKYWLLKKNSAPWGLFRTAEILVPTANSTGAALNQKSSACCCNRVRSRTGSVSLALGNITECNLDMIPTDRLYSYLALPHQEYCYLAQWVGSPTPRSTASTAMEKFGKTRKVREQQIQGG